MLLSAAGLYLLLYIAVLLPPVQDFLCHVAAEQLSYKTGGRVQIGELRISPFNELQLYDVQLDDPKGQPVMQAQTIAAGISLGKLIFDRRVVITYAEIIALDAHITQAKPGGPTNIQFLIDAFKSKEKKEPAKFDIVLNNVILRDCSVSYDRLWIPAGASGKFDANHIRLTDLSADLRMPILKNEEFKLDLRQLTFKESSGLTVNKLSCRLYLSKSCIEVNNLNINMPGTQIALPDMAFDIDGWQSLDKQLLDKPLSLKLSELTVTPADFACFVPALKHYTQTAWITLDMSYYDGELHVGQLDISSQPGIKLIMKGDISGLTGPFKEMKANFPTFKLDAEGRSINSIINDFATLPDNTKALISRLGDVKLDASVSGSAEAAEFDGSLSIAQGAAEITAKYKALADNGHSLKGEFHTEGFDLGSLLDNDDFGLLRADITADLTFNGNDPLTGLNGTATVDVPLFTYKGYPYVNIYADVSKDGSTVTGAVSVADPNIEFDIDADVTIAGAQSSLDALADIRVCNLSAINPGTPYDDISLTGTIETSLTGNNLSNVQGFVDIQNLRYSAAGQAEITADHLFVESQRSSLPYSLTIHSDYFDFDIIGQYDIAALPASFKGLAAYFLPDLLPGVTAHNSSTTQDFDFTFTLKKDSGLLEKIKSPVTLFEDLVFTGTYNSQEGVANLNMDIPYMLQGEKRLIKDTRLALDVDTAADKCQLDISTILPTDKGDVSFAVSGKMNAGKVDTDIHWDLGRQRAYNGLVSLTGKFDKDAATGKTAIDVNVNPSTFAVSDTIWTVDPGTIHYCDKSLTVNNVKVHRPGQYALIDGTATESEQDKVLITLDDIDLDYIFETLNIEYVQFGGRASGTVTAAAVFSKEPHLYTDDLVVNNITYNHCVLGDAYIQSHFDMDKKSVYLDADIMEDTHRVAHIYGDIFVVAEALDLNFDADKVKVDFLKPFMIAFCSDVNGRATGNVRLFGTFRDVDLTGKVFANELNMKIDVLNTWYSVSDTVVLEPGSINIDNVTVYDREGHTALLNGKITHRYFHEPKFDFSFSKAEDFLVYDTNATINPIWYGTVYGSGSGTIHGIPGFIDIKVDVTTCPRSTFTFVISDTEEAETFEFITFTDKRKEAAEAALIEQHITVDETPWYIKDFYSKQQKKEQQAALATRYAMDIRVTATPEADLTIVMDPVMGDKIKANGSGSLRMSYNSEGELDLYGAYSIDKGSYNFTLQDVIVRDFKIREGSKITFAGDPFAAILDITAAYRVNTSLTDLDKSFADDRELNRTNVPVEALLKVTGPMTSPDIDFDIELPTLTEDVSRKVKSIVSTSDMMNRQIVYLLALNRFYTPDYMSTNGSNNELASVASTTISSQLSSVLGELTPGWSFSPYFRTEKGDFSDMEVDLALSSSLLNNRLILNGNLGYRDKSTSSTTFIGDFDIEYLLNRPGTWRLKAYNHFNDQNYYLRSALTTQGVGIVFKKDFEHFLPRLFKRKRKKKSTPAEATEPVTTQPAIKPDDSNP